VHPPSFHWEQLLCSSGTAPACSDRFHDEEADVARGRQHERAGPVGGAAVGVGGEGGGSDGSGSEGGEAEGGDRIAEFLRAASLVQSDAPPQWQLDQQRRWETEMQAAADSSAGPDALAGGTLAIY
jgi:hypothetical protein